MFYWSHADTYVVLSDEEEVALIQELSDDPIERFQYHTSRTKRAEFERRIFQYFKENLRTDPDTFHRRFVFRSCYDQDAQKMFPVLLDAYGRITMRATIGWFGDIPSLEQIPEKFYYGPSKQIFEITLFERGRWPWSQPIPTGYISLPIDSIEKLAGTVDKFFHSNF